MKLPIYDLIINQDENNDAEVSFVALVDSPAIKKDFIAFKEEFIDPNKGEQKDEFLPRCISYVINEGKETEQAVAICNSLWEQHFAGLKISFDYDDTLSTSRGKELAKKEIEAGNTVYIISARSDKSPMLSVAKDLGIPESRVYATSSNKAKVEKVKELGIAKHYDNNADVIKELGGIGEKFGLMAFAIQSESEHIITGPLMIPQQLIYRNSEQFGEHYVKFSVDTIKQIAIKFSKKGYQKNVNVMHEADMQVDGVTMFESFISDSKRGIKPMEAFKDLPDGTWFGSFYVENPKVWEMIKQGNVKGFSVEGMFDYEAPMSEDQKQLAELREILNSF
jgi:hydroxymethylpyrimidine pyrophosphatase-like HAD family hydrolase